MEFKSSKKVTNNGDVSENKGLPRVKVTADKLLEYPLAVNFYCVPPTGQLELDEAEELVAERIRLLRVFENPALEGLSFGDTQKNIDLALSEVKSKREKNFYVSSQTATSAGKEGRRMDHVSHFLLRLYCCRTEELKKWFIWHETKFLQFQLMKDVNMAEIDKFLLNNNLDFEEVTNPDLVDQLRGEDKVGWDMLKLSISNQKFFKLPFESALDHVKNRKVYLEKGYVYIPSTEMISIILVRFRMELSHSLASMSRRLQLLDEEDRLIPRFGSVYYDLVTKVDQMKRADEKLANKQRITPDMIDDLAVESFPPCMRSMHENLRKNHHLKHYGRLHYGLFLKSVGLSLQDALQFFKEEFIQSMAPEKFAKEYSYNIRYNYGQEGKRVNLSAFGCKKIINDNPPGPGDSHGCPFKHFDKENLTSTLKRFGADDESVKEMLLLAEKKDFCGACTKYFSTKHPNYVLRSDTQDIYHPNQFFSESRRAHRGIYDVPKEEDQEVEGEAPDDDPSIFDDDDFDQSFIQTGKEQDLEVRKVEDEADSKTSEVAEAENSETCGETPEDMQVDES